MSVPANEHNSISISRCQSAEFRAKRERYVSYAVFVPFI